MKEQGLKSEAEAAYRRALEIEPELQPVFLNLGVVLLRNGKAAEAAPLLALESRPFSWF